MADVIFRYAFNQPIPGVIEYNGMLLAVFAFMGLAMTQRMQGHIRVTFLVSRLGRKPRNCIDFITLILSMVFVTIMGYETLLGALHSFQIKEYYWGVIGQTIYIWWAKFALPIGLLILCLQYLLDIIGIFTPLDNQMSDEETSIE
jgi:TRAP-type C4-dicarboxylate transport system permease small subunit